MSTTSDRIAAYLTPDRTESSEAQGQGGPLTTADAAGTAERIAAMVATAKAGAWQNVVIVEPHQGDQAVTNAIAGVLATGRRR